MRNLLLVLAFIAVITASGRTHYSTIHNGFAPLQCARPQQARFDGDFLVADNSSAQPLMVIDTTAIGAKAYRYQIRVANEHNAPRRSYKVIATDGNQMRIASPVWGMVFDMNQNGTDYWAVMLQCSNSDVNDDLNDRRAMTASLVHYRSDGDIDTISQQVLDKGVNLHSGFNTLQAQVSQDEIIISIGDKELKQIIQAARHAPPYPVKAGCCIGGGAKVKIERSVLALSAGESVSEHTSWTLETLQQHFDSSIDPNEGFWVYQDRDMEEKWLRLGGRYKLAVVATSTGYDIIYIDGAVTRNELWTPGMLKGRMTETIFSNHYDLMWIDATLQPISEDAYATFENGVLLNLKFPIYKSQLRLSKVILQ